MTEQRVEAVERALSILEAFSAERQMMSLADLSRETGLYKSTLLRLAASLERYGYLTRNERGLFKLGPSLWRLGSLYRRSYDLGELIRPELRSLVAATGETASYYVREDNERVCLYRENSKELLRYHIDEGTRLPLDRGAAAHVLNRYADPGVRRSQKLTLDDTIETVGERSPHVAAVAAPVFMADGMLRGSLAISGPIARFGPEARMAARHELLKSANRLFLLKEGGR
ncbi:IclR family transcriptional regulator [Pacificispira sp.]|uniref:IclR family transcriptional regulator n=1 Tax=Pacificispira sp. TaxID=2888761 RepID=UPI003BAC04B4